MAFRYLIRIKKIVQGVSFVEFSETSFGFMGPRVENPVSCGAPRDGGTFVYHFLQHRLEGGGSFHIFLCIGWRGLGCQKCSDIGILGLAVFWFGLGWAVNNSEPLEQTKTRIWTSRALRTGFKSTHLISSVKFVSEV